MNLSERRKMLAVFIGLVALACPLCMADIIPYTVKKGDTLWRIAQRHRTSVVFLRRLNGLQDDALRVGQELKVCTGPVKIVVDKSECMMRIYSGQDLLAEFSVAVGKPGKTPSATYTVKTKLVNPEWTHPETKEVIKFGDPRHEIGTRWLGIGGGLGIHGTNDPDSIGKPVSSGCIRLRNEEIESVFWAIPRGTVVEIQD